MRSVLSVTFITPARRNLSASHALSASRPGDLDIEAAAVVADAHVVDAQEKRPGFFHVEGRALANKEELAGRRPRA